MEEINSQFNKELQQQINGTLPKGHIYSLGYPGVKLLSGGVENLPMELISSELTKKAGANYKNKHPFALEDIKNLPEKINDPIAIFNSTKLNDSSKIILTELKDKNDNNFVVILKVLKKQNKNKISVEVNDIRSIYPKDRKWELINWLMSGNNKLVAWLDKEKAQNFIFTKSPFATADENKAGSINKYTKNSEEK